MSSLIEQAALRLEQLRRAGAEIPDDIRSGAAADAQGTGRAGKPEGGGAAGIALPGAPPAAPEIRSKRVELDLDALAAAGFVSPAQPKSQLAEEFRVIKRPLLANAAGKGARPVRNGNLIMVTSALPGEGKTFTAVNLAMSMAMEMERTVMLVDADVAYPSLLKLFGLPAEPGLLDLLLDHSRDLSGVLLRTNVERLSILSGGTQHSRATELLASDAMANLIVDIAKRYSDRIIVFDSPPLLVTTESRVLASHMGQIVLVVEAERTSQTEVVRALDTIEECPVKLTLLNKAKARFEDRYGDAYGYGYGYGQAV